MSMTATRGCGDGWWRTRPPNSVLAREPKPGEDGDVVRVVIAEDSVLLREGVARLLEDAGFDVAARAGDADDLRRRVRADKPDGQVPAFIWRGRRKDP
jgi:hypothetical protein